MVTILYAIVGIPLTLLTITNLGGFMATAFRWFYKNVVSGICCCKHCGRSSEAKRRKAAAAATAAAVEATKTVGREVARSHSNRSTTVKSANFNVAAPSTVAVAATSASEGSIPRSSSRESSFSGVRRNMPERDFQTYLLSFVNLTAFEQLFVALKG